MNRTREITIRGHYEQVWQSKPTIIKWNRGPIQDLPVEFSILRFKPNRKRKMWTYATCCMSQYFDVQPIELHLFSMNEDEGLIELLTSVVHYHRTGSSLNLGHSINFGRPWLPFSKCSYGLISLPYLDGPNLEWIRFGNEAVRFLWLIPVTSEEIEYKKSHGLEALEEKLEESGFHYADPLRKSVV